MIEIQRIRSALEDVERRAKRHADTYEWMSGELSAIPSGLLPTPADVQGHRDLIRLGNQAQTLGPRAKNIKMWGILGSINWGGDNPGGIDQRLEDIKLEELARRFLLQAFSMGMMCGLAFTDANTGRPRIQRLGGYVEPLLDPDDMDYVTGIYQCWQSNDEREPGWKVRIFDLEAREMREWTRLQSPTELARTPTVTRQAPMPRYVILDTGPDGLPLGEFEVALPLLQSEWASQVRGDRAEEATAWPQLVIRGEVDTAVRGVTRVIQVQENGGAEYLSPGDLRQMHEHHNRKLERLREDLSLPGYFSGAQTPSGAALREMASKFTSSNMSYASALGEILTGLCGDYGVEAGAFRRPEDGPSVVVNINRESLREIISMQVREDYKAGIIPLRPAVIALQPYYPHWEDEELEAYLAENELEPLPDRPEPGALEDEQETEAV